MNKLINDYLKNIEMNEKNIKRKNLAAIITLCVEFIKIIITFIFIKEFTLIRSVVIFLMAALSSILALYILNNDDYSKISKYNVLDFSGLIFLISNIIGGILIEAILFKAQKNMILKLSLKNLKIKKLPNKLFHEKKVYLFIFITLLICYERLYVRAYTFYILTFIGIIPFFINDIKQSINEFKKRKKNYLLYTLKVYFITWFIAGLLFILTFLIVGEDSTNQQLLEQEPIWLLTITSIIHAPIVEELLYRGCLRKIIKNDIAFILISGIGFGIWHVIGYEQSIIQYLYAIPYSIMGLGLSYVYAKTNNLTTNIGMHSFHNMMSSIVSLI